MLSLRAVDLQSWRVCTICAIYYPTLALVQCPRDYCGQTRLSPCSSAIRSFLSIAWLFTNWQIWLCQDCSRPMTQRTFRTIGDQRSYRRVCCDCWISHGCPSYAEDHWRYPPRATYGVYTVDFAYGYSLTSWVVPKPPDLTIE